MMDVIKECLERDAQCTFEITASVGSIEERIILIITTIRQTAKHHSSYTYFIIICDI